MGKGPGSSAIRKRELCVIRFVAKMKGEASGRKEAEKPKKAILSRKRSFYLS